jgi:hypothetical protein
VKRGPWALLTGGGGQGVPTGRLEPRRQADSANRGPTGGLEAKPCHCCRATAAVARLLLPVAHGCGGTSRCRAFKLLLRGTITATMAWEQLTGPAASLHKLALIEFNAMRYTGRSDPASGVSRKFSIISATWSNY